MALGPTPSQSSIPTRFENVSKLHTLTVLKIVTFRAHPSLLRNKFVNIAVFFIVANFLTAHSMLGVISHAKSFKCNQCLVHHVAHL